MAGFEVRRWEPLTQAMVDWIQSNPDTADGIIPSDLNVGSLERSHLEASAIVAEEYDVRTAAAVERAISEACFHAFGFDRLPAATATGSVEFYSVAAPLADIPIPIGTKLVAKGGQLFATTALGAMLAGQTVSAAVPVVAAVGGVDGNVPDGFITVIAYPIPGIDGVSNPLRTLNGAPEEGEDGRLARFQKFIRTLVRATDDSIEFAILNTGLVTEALVVEPWALDPIPAGAPVSGWFYAFVDDGVGSGALSSEVSEAVTKAIFGYIDGTGKRVPGWKAAGARVDVYPVVYRPVKVRGAFRITPTGRARWADIQARLTAAATAYFATLKIASPVSYQDLLVALALCDDDIVTLNLWIWLQDSVAPAYDAPQTANDLTVASSATAAGVGVRAVLLNGNDDEQGGSTVAYPEWILL